jgi:hypothetical protein
MIKIQKRERMLPCILSEFSKKNSLDFVHILAHAPFVSLCADVKEFSGKGWVVSICGAVEEQMNNGKGEVEEMNIEC